MRRHANPDSDTQSRKPGSLLSGADCAFASQVALHHVAFQVILNRQLACQLILPSVPFPERFHAAILKTYAPSHAAIGSSLSTQPIKEEPRQ